MIKPLKLNQKISLVIFAVMCISLLFATLLLYEIHYNVYKNYTVETLINRVESISAEYEESVNKEDVIQQLEWLNEKTESHIYFFDNVMTLNNNLPFEYEDDYFVTKKEESLLKEGKQVVKAKETGKLEDKLLAVVQPVMNDGSMVGVMLTYSVTLFLANEWIIAWGILSISFIVIMSYLLSRVLKRAFAPLAEIEQAAHQISKGNFNTPITYRCPDEIGKVAQAFNRMSKAIHDQEIKKEEILADISHEIRTPLTYIKSYLHVLMDGLVKSKAEENKYLTLISRETNRLHRLVQGLLDLNKLEANVIQLNCQPIVFAQLVEDIMMKYESICQEKRLHLSYSLDYDIIIYGDEERIEQILQNIIDNSIKYSKENGSIRVELEEIQDEIQISVSDNGLGMSRESLSKITDRYFRVKKTHATSSDGVGIGLSIVEKLVHLHNGRMKIESELHVGTKVRLIFPKNNTIMEGELKVI